MLKDSKHKKGKPVMLYPDSRRDEEGLLDTGATLPIGEPYSYPAVPDSEGSEEIGEGDSRTSHGRSFFCDRRLALKD